MKKKLVFFLSLLLCLLNNAGFATTYYNKSSGTAALQTLSNWGTNTDGTGTAPGNFTTAGSVFNLYNGSTGTISAAWVITGVTLNVGTGSAAMNLTIPSGSSLTGTGVVNVSAGATLTLQNATNPLFGTLNATSTVNYNGTGAQTIALATYGNLGLSGARSTFPTITLASGTINVSGDFIVSYTGTVFFTTTGNTFNYTSLTSGQTIGGITYQTLNLNNTSGTDTAGGAVVVNGTLNTTAGGTLNMATYALSGSFSDNNNGTLETECTGATPIPAGKTWAGTVTYDAASGGQTVMAGTYSNLVLGNTSGTSTASGAIIVNNSLTTTSGGILSMTNAYTLSGSMSTITNNGTISTAVLTTTSATPIPSGKTWGGAGTVLYAAATGAQTIVSGTYDNLTLNNSSATNTAGGAITVNTSLTTTSGGTFAMGANQLSGSFSPANNGTITTTSTANPAIPAGLSWTGTTGSVTFAATGGGQFIPAGTYKTLTLSNSSSTNTAVGNLTVTTGLTTTSGGTLAMGSYQLSGTPTVTNNGTITTTCIVNPAIPAGLSWSGTTGVVTFAATSGAQYIPAGTFKTLNLTNTSGADTAVGTLSITTLLATTAGGALFMGTNPLSGTITTFTNNGTIYTQNTGATPIPSGKIIGGTVNYNASGGGQTIIAETSYANLVSGNSGGTNTAGAALSITNTLTTTAGGILDMSTYALSGAFTVTNNGTIQTENTSGTPIPSGKTWGGIVNYNAATGGQTVMGGTYATLTLSNTSGTSTANGAITVNTALNTAAGGTFDMATNVFSGSLTTINNNGTIKTENGGLTPFPTGKTWGGTVLYNSTSGTQTAVAGTYYNLGLGGGSGSTTVTLAGAITVNNTLTINATATFSTSSSNYQINIEGNWVNNGTAFTANSGTVIFDGTSTQSIGGSLATSFHNLTISNTSAAVSVNTNTNVNTTLNMSGTATTLVPLASVVFNSGGAAGTITGSGTIEVTRTASTADYVNQYKFTTNTLTSMAVDYAGSGAQTINSTVGNYGYLLTDGSGTKTLAGAVTINNDLTIGSGTTLSVSPSNYQITVDGNWTNNGTFTAENGAVYMSGTATGLTLSGSMTGTSKFNSIVFLGGSTATWSFASNDVEVGNTFNVSTGTVTAPADTLTVEGNWYNGASFNNNNGTVVFSSPLTGLLINGTTGGLTGGNEFNNLFFTGSGGAWSFSLSAADVGGDMTIATGATVTAPSSNLQVAGDWNNNGTFTHNNGTVTFNGTSAQTVGGSSNTTFYNLALNNGLGAALGNNETVNNTLTLSSGTLNIGNNNLVLGSSATAVSGTFSSSNMIIANGNGYVVKQYSANGSYTFPIGDTLPVYSPITLSVSGSAYSGASVSVNVTNTKHPDNANVTNYLNRYWSVAISGITSPSYSVTGATYVIGDVTGTEADMSMGQYSGSLPWIKFGATNATTHTLSSTSVTATSSDFTGINTTGPSVTASSGTSICAGSSATISVSAYTADPVPTYTWAPGASLSATTGTSVTATPTVTTTYTLTITDGNGFKGSATTTVSVVALPSAISGTTVVCAGTTTTLSDAGGGTWSSGNTGIATVGFGTGVVTGIAVGTATITYTVGSGCFAATTVTINPLPSAISGTGGVCIGATTTLSDAGGGTWSSSNTTLATIGSSSGVVTGVAAGTPTITYKLGSGCLITTAITVNPLPSAISGTTVVCAGSATTLSDAGGGTWASSNTSLATVGSSSGVVTGVASGTPSITYTLGTGCLTSAVVTVNPLPSAISGTAFVCSGSTTTLSDGGGGTWSSSNTTLATVGSSTGVVTGVSSGTPTITYTLATGCISSVTATINPLPSAIAGTTAVCTSATTTLSDASGGGTWVSSSTTVATIGSGTGIVTPVTTGTSTITYTLGTGCKTTAAVTVSTKPSLSSASNSGPICAGVTLTLTANSPSNVTGYLWSGPVSITSSTSSTATVPSATTAANGTYTVTVSNGTGAGCSISYTTTATVDSTPVAAPSNSGTICIGGATKFSANPSGGASVYLWSGPNLSSTTAENPSATPTVTATYSLTVTNGTGYSGCSPSTVYTTTVTVNSVPTAAPTNNGPVCSAATVTLTANPGGGANTYTWSGSNLSSTTAQNPTATPTVTGTYSLTVSYGTGQPGCSPATVYTTTVTVTPAGNWLGGTSADWNTGTNWCGSVPSATTNVLIPSGTTYTPVISSGTAYSNNLTIQSSAALAVNGGTLQIAGTISNSGTFADTGGTIVMDGSSAQTIPANTFSGNVVKNLTINNSSGVTLSGTLGISAVLKATTGNFHTAGYLTLLSTASQTALIDGSGGGAVLDTVSMQRYLSSGLGYRYISSPFAAATVKELSSYITLSDTFPDLYNYNENLTSTGWVIDTVPGSILYPLYGYSADFGSLTSAKTISLRGIVNNGAMVDTLYNHNNTYTLGYNLAGNPFPSPIDWEATTGWTKTSIDDAIYYFNNDTASRYTGIYSSYIGGVSSDGVASNIIPAMQGFFIHVSNGTYPVKGVLGVTNNVRVNNLSPYYHKTSVSSDPPLLRLEAGFTNGIADPAVIYFDDSATAAFDKHYDAFKMMNTDVNVPNLSVLLLDTLTQLSIQAMPVPADSNTNVIPLGLSLQKDGLITFNSRDIENMPSGMHIYFHDAKTGAVQDLRSTPKYSQYLGKGDYENRFFLMFTYKDAATIPVLNTQLNAYTAGNNLFVYLVYGTGDLVITDMLGQVVLKQPLTGNGYHEVNLPFASGIYVATLFSSMGKQSKKILLLNQ